MASLEPTRRGRSQSRGVKVESEGSGSGSDVDRIGSKGSKGRQTRGSQRTLVNGRAKGKGKGKEKEQALFLDDVDEENAVGSAPVHDLAPEDLEEIDLDIDADEDDEEEDEPVKPTRKRAATASKAGVASPAKGKKRTAAVLDDDSDSGMTFRGFAGRKKTRAK